MEFRIYRGSARIPWQAWQRPIVSPRCIGVFGNDARCTCARVSARFIDKPSNKPWIYLSSRVTWFRVPINCYEVATPTLHTHPRVWDRYRGEPPVSSYCFVTNRPPFFYCSILFRWRFDARGVPRTPGTLSLENVNEL